MSAAAESKARRARRRAIELRPTRRHNDSRLRFKEAEE
jgi:hypothetical protein